MRSEFASQEDCGRFPDIPSVNRPSAAAHFGWPVSLYRAHESGTRNILKEDLAKYAKGLRVPTTQLMDPDPERIEKQLRAARQAIEGRKREVALRLKATRILRGYTSAGQASVAIGVKTATFLKHENASNGLQDDTAEFYASMLGISPEWLRTGRLPSGLGHDVDARIRSVLSHPENHTSLVEKRLVTPPDNGSVISLRPGRPPLRTVKISEYRWSELEGNCADVKKTIPCGLVTMPGSESTDSGDTFPISVIADKPVGQIQRYSRIFVVAYDRTAPEAEYLIFDGRQLGVFLLKRGQAWKIKDTVVGRLIGKLDSFELEPER
jgi:hypothetical protein